MKDVYQNVYRNAQSAQLQPKPQIVTKAGAVRFHKYIQIQTCSNSVYRKI